jgi:hypothetical protein
VEETLKLIPVPLSSEESDETRDIFKAQAEVVNVGLLESSKDLSHDLTRRGKHGVPDLLLLSVGWVRYINTRQVLSKLVAVLNTVLAMVQLLSLSKVEDTVAELFCAMPVLGLEQLLNPSATGLDSEKREVNLSSTTILSKLAKDSEIEDTKVLISHILEVRRILVLEELEESLVENKKKLRALVLNPETTKLGTTF